MRLIIQPDPDPYEVKSGFCDCARLSFIFPGAFPFNLLIFFILFEFSNQITTCRKFSAFRHYSQQDQGKNNVIKEDRELNRDNSRGRHIGARGLEEGVGKSVGYTTGRKELYNKI